ncbi:Cytochrome P450 2K1 [Channa argus]|uniref:Cytochrome P450 2K1 n=1 Tax=Channa argus TaxID=215402 RepID=A0A6G1QC92_CHAAH|nr:Cytochrome P450 2K1 [Channa argus]
MLDVLFQSTFTCMLCAVGILLVLQLLYSSFTSQGKWKEPPGPRPLQLLGNLLQLDLRRLDRSLFDLSKKYGPVFTVYFGFKKVVVLAGYRTVKQALLYHAEEFGDREVTPLFNDFNKGHGILFTNGDTWQEMRRFALTTLRDFGMGKRLSEEKIIEECHYLIEEFEQHKGKAFNSSQTIKYASSNILHAIMFGKRFGYKDPVLRAIVDRDDHTIHLSGSPSIMLYNLFPWLGPFISNWRKLMENVEANKLEIISKVEDLKNTLNTDSCRCFVDAFLHRKQSLEDSKTKNSHYTDDNLVYSVMNLLAAGTDTTGTTVQWCLLFMAKYPHIQGRRVCLGESLARMELFLFFTSLLQRFCFTPAPGVTEDELDLTPIVGFTLTPSPHPLCTVSRQ